MRSDVVIVGYRLNAKEPAAKALERILGLAAADARQLARGFPALVARDLAAAEAAALQAELQAAGAQVELRPHLAAAPREPLAARAAHAAPPAAAESYYAGTAAAHARLPEPDYAPPDTTHLVFPEPNSAPRPRASDVENSYTLGDFGLGPAAPQKPESAAPRARASAPTAPASDDVSLELDYASSASLELDVPSHQGSAGPFQTVQTTSDVPNARGDRFDDLAPTAAIPEVEARALKAIQRAPRPPEPRRSSRPAPSATARTRRAVTSSLGAWLPSLLLLSALTIGTLLSIGYALNPDDAIGALQRESEAHVRTVRGAVGRAAEPGRDAQKELHPLLQSAPAAIRPPLAAILRARVAGIHQVPVSFALESGAHADCLLVEQRDTADDARLVALRETGSAVAPPAQVAAELEVHARALREREALRGIALTPLCLAL